MRTDMFIKSYRATAAIAKHRLVRASASADATITQAAAAADPIMGVHGSLAAAANDVTDVVCGGYATVEYGGPVTRGAPLTSDASGRAIPKAAGISNGYALDAASAAGELIRIVRGI